MSDQDDYVAFLRKQRAAVRECLEDITSRMQERVPSWEDLARWQQGRSHLASVDSQLEAALRQQEAPDLGSVVAYWRSTEHPIAPAPIIEIAGGIPEAEAARFRAAFQERTGRAPVVLSYGPAVTVKPSPDGRVNWPLIAEAETEIWGEPFDHDRSYEHARTRRRPPALAPAVGALVLLAAVFALGWLMAVML